jgi:hypothetical protein
MAKGYEAIYFQNLTSTASSLRFNNIPQGYTDLLLKVSPRGNRAAPNIEDMYVTFNDDTASNYSFGELYGDGSNMAFTRLTSQNSGRFLYGNTASCTAGSFGICDMYIPNYSSASTFKSFNADSFSESNDVATYQINISGLWRNLAPITSIKIDPTTTPFQIGTSLSLYGITK